MTFHTNARMAKQYNCNMSQGSIHVVIPDQLSDDMFLLNRKPKQTPKIDIQIL